MKSYFDVGRLKQPAQKYVLNIIRKIIYDNI
jgi:hypothetical protein